MAPAPTTPPPEAPEDPALAGAVRAALAGDGRLGDCRLVVSVVAGVVTLTGDVENEFQRGLAIAFASGVPGVLVVEPRIGVLQDGPLAKPGM